MKAFNKNLAISASIAAIASIVGIGSVAPAFSQIVAVKDAEGRVFVRGLTPAVPTEYTFTGVTQTKVLVSNDCGAVTVRGSASVPIASSINVNGTAVDTTALPIGVLPSCVSGAFSTPVPANFKTATGQVVVIGLTPNSAITVTQLGDRVRKGTPNACGIGRLASSASFTVAGNFTVAGTSLDVATIPTGLPPICRSGNLYLPAN